LRYAARNGCSDKSGSSTHRGQSTRNTAAGNYAPRRSTRAVPWREARRQLARLDQKRRRPCRYSTGDDRAVGGIRRASLKLTTGILSGSTFSGCETGKSTVLVAASSVAGVGREEELPNWAGRRQQSAKVVRFYCDRLMPVNELGLIAKKSAYAKIQQRVSNRRSRSETVIASRCLRQSTTARDTHHLLFDGRTLDRLLCAARRRDRDEGELAAARHPTIATIAERNRPLPETVRSTKDAWRESCSSDSARPVRDITTWR